MLNTQTAHRRASRVLPEVFATSGIAVDDVSEAGLAALLFPFRRPGSGAVIFRLCERNAKELEADPVAFLRNARAARDDRGVVRYREWRSVQLDCGKLFFTARCDGRAVIVVVPEERWVAYVWRDRASTLCRHAGEGVNQNNVTPGASHNEKPASVQPMAVAASTSLG